MDDPATIIEPTSNGHADTPTGVDASADPGEVVEALRRQVVGEVEPDGDPGPASGDPGSGEAPEGSAPPADDGEPRPHTFTDRAAFLSEREAFVASIVDRLEHDDDGDLARKIMAEIYATTVELRLSLYDLDAMMIQGRAAMSGGLGKMLGRIGKGKGNDAEA